MSDTNTNTNHPAERPAKRLRGLSTDYDDDSTGSPDDWIPTKDRSRGLPQQQQQQQQQQPESARASNSRSLRSRKPLTVAPPSPPATNMSRRRRAAPDPASSPMSSITVAHPPAQPKEDPAKSMRLTVKVASSKLREATSGARQNVSVNSRDNFVGGEIVSGPRGSRAKKAIVEDSDSEEEEEEDDDDDDAMDEDVEEESDVVEDEDDDADADADADADGDADMDDAPPPPIVISKAAPVGAKPSLTITPASNGKIQSVESKEMGLDDNDDDDEELSELESEEEPEEMDEGGEEDAEGEEVGDEEDEDEDPADSDDETPAGGSRASTPDINKLTRRQRGAMTGELLALPSEAKVKKHLTAEEHAMRRAEMARRRKNLSEKRNEEEKMDTINRLLKKQAPKRRGRAAAGGAVDTAATATNGDATPNPADGDAPAVFEKANPLFVRWVSSSDGVRVGVPAEWGGKPVGSVFGMIEEIVEPEAEAEA
ncbi:MAG: hypothetical protein M1819_002143 [Sarea resinae]|nr:MAG: hypothetical protein M1819_002143 [Sarea resinae]